MLHSSLKHIVSNQQIINSFIDEIEECDEIDSFEPNEHDSNIFDDFSSENAGNEIMRQQQPSVPSQDGSQK